MLLDAGRGMRETENEKRRKEREREVVTRDKWRNFTSFSANSSFSEKKILFFLPFLPLAILWQLMRFHILSILSSLGEKQISEDAILNWANEKVLL